jgi:hypothetical protein
MTARLVDRPPLEEIAKRAAEAGAGLAAGAKAVGLANHREMLRDHAKRVRDDHEWAKQLRGQEPTVAGGDDMGDIIVTGDIYGDQAVKALGRVNGAPTQPPTQPPASPQSSWASKALPWILAGAAGLGGAGLASILIDRQPVVDIPAVEMPQYDVEKWVPE